VIVSRASAGAGAEKTGARKDSKTSFLSMQDLLRLSNVSVATHQCGRATVAVQALATK
jgi:hypothetical protein